MRDQVVAVRRYPVKSMGGEDLAEVELDARGLHGDRWWAVVDEDGRLASAKSSRRFRRRDAVLDHAASTRDGRVVVTGPGGPLTVGDPALDDLLSGRTGARVALREEAAVPHQDGGAVSLVGTATLAWCAERWGVEVDPRRLRVNLVLATTEPFVEESWVGLTLRLGREGGAGLRVVERVPRCRTVDLAQDGVEPRGALLAPLAQERDLCLAVYADVVTPGRVRVGDPVALDLSA